MTIIPAVRGAARPSHLAVPGPRTAPGVDTGPPASTPDELLPALSRLGTPVRLALVAAAWAASVAVSSVVSVGAGLHDVAAAVHVLSLVTAFGAVLLVDWHGALWMLGRRSLQESSRIAAGASPLIWLGIGGLLASGALLSPDLGQPYTRIKLLLVLVVALNGATLSATRRALAARPAGERLRTLPAGLRRSVMVSAVVSQTGWWGAMAIGFLTAADRL